MTYSLERISELLELAERVERLEHFLKLITEQDSSDGWKCKKIAEEALKKEAV
jgi:hypothetical protein